MRTVLVKDDHRTGGTSLANPTAKPGRQNDTTTIKAITGVPDEVSAPAVARTWNQTVDLTWLGKPGNPMERGRFTFDWSEIGPGRIVR